MASWHGALVVLPMAGACAPPPPRAPPPPTTCDVWDRELSFADSVARHDTKGFREHLLPRAVFVDGSSSLLDGPDAIARAWAKIVAGEGLALGWRPTTVAFTDPRVAMTRGPYWIEVAGANGTKRFLTGTFQSVWVRDVDGVWRVAIDGGTAEPAEAKPEDIERLKAWAPLVCPKGQDTAH
jgi:ketosteroid isomerase-like protein